MTQQLAMMPRTVQQLYPGDLVSWCRDPARQDWVSGYEVIAVEGDSVRLLSQEQQWIRDRALTDPGCKGWKPRSFCVAREEVRQ